MRVGSLQKGVGFVQAKKLGGKVVGYVHTQGAQGGWGKGTRCVSTGKLRERACWCVCCEQTCWRRRALLDVCLYTNAGGPREGQCFWVCADV